VEGVEADDGVLTEVVVETDGVVVEAVVPLVLVLAVDAVLAVVL